MLGMFISPHEGSGTLAFLPGIGEVSDALLERLAACEAILFDGTFWSNDEPARIPGLGRTARQMGHMPVSGDGGSMDRLAALSRPRKIFIHINNTNPVLVADTAERSEAERAGWEIAYDGMEIEL